MKQINAKAPAVQRDEMVMNQNAESVWEVLKAVEEWPSWNSDIKDARLEGALVAGGRFRWKSGGVTINSELHTVERNKVMGWTGKAIGTKAIHNIILEPQADGQTKVRVEESLSGWMPRYFKKGFQKMLETGMRKWLLALKAEVEKRDLANTERLIATESAVPAQA